MTPLDGPFPENKPELLPEVAALPPGDLLLPYQARANLLSSTALLLVIEKSRRIGLTWGIAAQAVLTAAASRKARGQNVYYMGYEKEMTREFIDVCSMWAEAFAIAASTVEEDFWPDPDNPKQDIQVFRIRFASGFQIVALPSVPRVLRGKQGLTILDEAAFMSELAAILTAALALLMWGGRVVVISTHNGVDNPFNQLLEEIRSGKREGETLKITLANAMAEGLYERICLVTGETPLPEGKIAWEKKIRAIYASGAAEELDCIPSSGAGAWLELGDIIAAEHPDAAKPELYEGGLCFVGWDVARRRDLSVIWVFELVAGRLWLRERIEMRKTKFQDQYDAVARVFATYRVVRLAIDQTGMGEAVVEAVQAKHGTLRVEGVILSGPARLSLATYLKERFESGGIVIPDDKEIRADLRAIKKISGPAGVPRLVNEGDVHADMFWAAALAAAAAAERVIEPKAEGLDTPPENGMEDYVMPGDAGDYLRM